MREEFLKWVEFFYAQPVRVLHGVDRAACLILSQADSGLTVLDEGAATEIKNTFQYRMLDKRAAFVGLVLTQPAKYVLASMCNNPGELVMFIYALRAKGVSYTAAQLLDQFQRGWPTDESLALCWEKQKLRGANLLDLLDLSECFPKETAHA